MPLRLVFAGTPQVAVPALQALLDSRHEVVAVVTRPRARAGRGRRSVVPPVEQVALDHALPVLSPDRPRDPAFVEALSDLRPDVCPVVAYGALVPPPVLQVPHLGWVNLHFSLLPAWRGAAPVQHAVLAGDDFTGATTFRLDAGMDSGPVLGTMTERIDARDTSGSLLDRLAVAGAQLLVATVDALEEGSITPVPQPQEGISAAPKITGDDARVRWGDPAFAVDRRVRAVTPAPGAWTTFRGDRIKVGPVTPVEASDSGIGDAVPSADLRPGQVRAVRDQVLVGTGAGAVRLGTVQPPGKKAMPAQDWARGARPDDDEVFGD